jgi:adenine phosphoribosyltransferase
MENAFMKSIKSSIRNVPDFPIPGIQFKDLSTLFKDGAMLSKTSDILYDYYKEKGITKVVAVESRGFVMGGILAYRLGAGFVMVRKPGKLPAETFKKEYTLEYGSNTIEIHKDALQPGDVVLLHDDLLATGGTSNAVVELLECLGVKIIFINFIVELGFLSGRKVLGNKYDMFSLVHY